jgi:hypothetical protein
MRNAVGASLALRSGSSSEQSGAVAVEARNGRTVQVTLPAAGLTPYG